MIQKSLSKRYDQRYIISATVHSVTPEGSGYYYMVVYDDAEQSQGVTLGSILSNVHSTYDEAVIGLNEHLGMSLEYEPR